ncbi:hypothetical protein AB4Y38_07685 [Paraburkholderia sp. EG285A]|uniref:hypothetical protein n=1 Tax=Paraburkholderia sp. EG285A TaxID=3237009 RepID=UPI0034D21BE2
MGLVKTREKFANRKPTARVAARLWQRCRLTARTRKPRVVGCPGHQKPDASAETEVNIDERKVGGRRAPYRVLASVQEWLSEIGPVEARLQSAAPLFSFAMSREPSVMTFDESFSRRS